MVVLVGMLLRFGHERVVPGIKLAGMEVGGMNKAELVEVVQRVTQEYKLALKYGEALLPVPPKIISFQVEETLDRVMAVGRSDFRTWWEVLQNGRSLEIKTIINEAELSLYIEELRPIVEIPGIPNELELVRGEVVITNGEDGVELDSTKLEADIFEYAKQLKSEPVEIVVRETRNMLQEEEITELQEIAGSLVDDEATIIIDEERAVLHGAELVSFLSSLPASLGEVDELAVESYMLGLAERFDRDPQDAVFEFSNQAVQEFAPALDGIKISTESGVRQIMEGVEKLKQEDESEITIEITVENTAPRITTEEVNTLGIVERIGKGESYYAHSIPNRVFNVGLASRRINGSLVGPGQEYSFNAEVGEISSATGYKTAYVISNGRTELGDGGGVCQVSTTTFRAALSAGLPITERWAHAYRVGYYEQNSKPGFDATIYSPSKDLRFLNDTPGHILVQTIVDEPNRHLIVEIYGTDDGRVASVSPARVWGVSPPPPDLYQDDPTLPAGTVKQVDWSAWGAKAAFDYQVERDGETITSRTFNSSFRPWQNVYLRGTAE